MVGITDEVSFATRIYPNPTAENIHVLSSGMSILNYQVFNNLGQLMSSGMVNSNLLDLNVSNWERGVYSLRIVKYGGEVEVHPFIVSE
jgi:hypothetical protein